MLRTLYPADYMVLLYSIQSEKVRCIMAITINIYYTGEKDKEFIK